jgi:SAM-dependent methyltransferase
MTADVAAIATFIEQLCRETDHPLASFWRRYWLETGHLRRLILTLEKLSPLFDNNPSVLDIGGFGELLLILRKFYGLTSVHGLSLEGNAFGYRDGRLLSYDDSNLEYSIRIDTCDVECERLQHDSNSLDIVTCFEVLEHLRYDPMFMLLEIHRVLRPGGILVLSTPNASSWESLARVAAFASPFIFSTYFAEGTGIGHCKEYSAFELRQALEQTGFSIDKLETLDCFPPDSGLEERFAELKAFVSSRDWWEQSLRGQTLLVEARKAEKPRRRMYVPLYTDELVYNPAQERALEGGVEKAGKDSPTQNSEPRRELAGLRNYVAALQAEVAARTRWALQLDEELRQERAASSKLQAECDQRGRWGQDLDKEIHKQRDHIAELEQRLQELNVQLHSWKFLIIRLWHEIRR